MGENLKWDTDCHEEATTRSKVDCDKDKKTTYLIRGHYEAADDCGGDNCAKQKKSADSTSIYKRETRQQLTQAAPAPPLDLNSRCK